VQIILKNLSDEELVNTFCIQKNTKALGILFERYAHLVYGVGMKYFKNPEQAKDATSQVFEKLLTDLHRHDVQIFKAWLYRVAQNHCLMQLRSNKHLTKSVDEFQENSVEYEDTLHPVLEKEIKLNHLEEAMQELNQDQKQCIDLFYLQKKSYTEIMKETGFSFMQVKSFIQNGKRNLKTKMNEYTNV
jgi:RNA polymerase sigma factor (sigma-70 family)